MNSDEEPSAAVVDSKTLRCALKSEFPQLSFMRVTNLMWSELVYFQENKSALHLLTSSGTESDSSCDETPARSGKEKYRTVHSHEEVCQLFHSATGLKTKLEQSPKLNAAWPPLAADLTCDATAEMIPFPTNSLTSWLGLLDIQMKFLMKGTWCR